MPPSSDPRARLVEAAGRLFQRRGYHGSGLTEILAVANAPKGSFYHYFPGGKAQLAGEAVRAAGAEIATMIEAAFADAADFADGAARLGAIVGDWFRASDYREGCPVVQVLLETTPDDAALAAVCRAVLDDWQARTAAQGERLGLTADIADARASLLVMGLEGAWIVSRARRDVAPFARAAAMAATARL